MRSVRWRPSHDPSLFPVHVWGDGVGAVEGGKVSATDFVLLCIVLAILWEQFNP